MFAPPHGIPTTEPAFIEFVGPHHLPNFWGQKAKTPCRNFNKFSVGLNIPVNSD